MEATGVPWTWITRSPGCSDSTAAGEPSPTRTISTDFRSGPSRTSRPSSSARTEQANARPARIATNANVPTPRLTLLSPGLELLDALRGLRVALRSGLAVPHHRLG